MARSQTKIRRSVEYIFKQSFHYALMGFINVTLIFIIVSGFSKGYTFGYQVFSDSVKNPGSLEKQKYTVEEDASGMDIAKDLTELGVVKDKYVTYAKIKVYGYNKKFKPGTYTVSPGMHYSEVLDTLTGETIKTEENGK